MTRNPLVERRALNEAVLATLKAHGFRARVADLPEGDEIEVSCVPRIPVRGARFFLRSERILAVPSRGRSKAPPPQCLVSARLLSSWRTVPEPVAVVGLDPETGVGRIGEAHPFLADLDRRSPGWEKGSALLFPLGASIDGPALPALARRAADAHVLYRRILDHLKSGGRGTPPRDADALEARLRQREFAFSLACLDLLREAGFIAEGRDRELHPTESCVAAFARAAVQHVVGARGHADPETADEAGRSAVVRLLLSRLPDVAETTVERCAEVLARLLPAEDADHLLGLGGGEEEDGGDGDEEEE
ncbi:MAG: hypothetical protein L6R43_01630 [Planctomycetes bacterium]|nr:hypothetical protein [Planctomycetota bacterium]